MYFSSFAMFSVVGGYGISAGAGGGGSRLVDVSPATECTAADGAFLPSRGIGFGYDGGSIRTSIQAFLLRYIFSTGSLVINSGCVVTSPSISNVTGIHRKQLSFNFPTVLICFHFFSLRSCDTCTPR